MRYSAGLDVGGTFVKRAIVDESGSVVYYDQRPTGADGGMQRVIDSLRHDIAFLAAHTPTLCGVGIGFPSVVDSRARVVHIPPNMSGWQAVDLWSALRSADRPGSPIHTPLRPDLPIVIDNDANVAAYAELRAGVALKIPSFLYITLGTGVGGAIVLHGQLIHGERGGAGEIGHLVISRREDDAEVRGMPDDRPFRRGVMERYCGRHALIYRAKVLLANDSVSVLHELGDTLDVHHISDAADNGDELSRRVLEDVASDLAIGVSSALNLLDIRTVVVGGGISQVSAIFFEALSRDVRLRVLPSLRDDITILRAHFNAQAGVIGAAMLAQAGSNSSDH